MRIPLWSLVWCLGVAISTSYGLETGEQLTYRGSIAKLNADKDPGDPEKTFDLELLVDAQDANGVDLSWVLTESGRGGWSWSDRCGTWKAAFDGELDNDTGPALLYDRDDASSVIPLPNVLLKPPAALAKDSNWSTDEQNYRVEEEQKLEGRDVWRLTVTNNSGRQRVVWLDKSAPLAVAIDARVFMGQGEEHQLQLRLVGRQQLTEEQRQRRMRDIGAIVALRHQMGRVGRHEEPALTERERARLIEALPEVERQVTSPALAMIVQSIRRDLDSQSARAGRVSELSRRFVGQPLGEFDLEVIGGRRLTKADLAGKVSVLHFWTYRAEPLREPYGQIGYLDFLSDKRRGDGVQIYGVAVDGRLRDADQRGAVKRGVSKLIDFMNLSYPVALDDGALLEQLGDPRLVGGQLPLFVVVGPDGRIAHYFVGCYEVERDAGLKQLDEAVSAALKVRP
ncbi:MAG: TlpA family protein disulfide reductase [Pirellulales bacterium]|nr:TlpA family protein disulfide reductase [Pirellulales bacterium]